MSESLERLRGALSDRYTVEREIGRGGMATVYLATDVRHGRRVAIKVLHPDLAAALGAERFLREIQIASQLTHPHILPVHDSGDAAGLLFYVMPFIDGESLRQRLAREKQLGIDEAIHIACEVADALSHAHSMGIVHRDIKPENILLEAGHAVVADFGIARAMSQAAGAESLTRTGVSLGTPQYMSPEQASAERDIDGRADIYSLGCVLYEMLAGHPPFTAGSSQALMARHALDPVPLLTTIRPSIPPEVEDVVLTALEKVPADRFSTVLQFRDALVAQPTGAVTRRSMMRATARTTRTGLRTMSPRRRAVLIAAGACSLLGSSWGAWQLWFHPNRLSAETGGTLANNANRIAVLYFQDESADGRLAPIADGLTEALIGELDQVQTLDVVSANGVEPFRGSAVDRDSVARALGVGTIVQGSLEPVGDRVRVTVRLVDAATGADFRRESFEERGSNPLAMRDRLAREVSRFLRARLGEEVQLQRRRAATSSADAWALVLRAERLRKDAEERLRAKNPAGADSALQLADSLLAQAEPLDERWVEPTVLRSRLEFRRARLPGVAPLAARPRLDAALAHAERALARDSRNADALEMRGTVRYFKYLLRLESDPRIHEALYAEAGKDFKAAVAVNPAQATAWSALSHYHMQVPDFVEAKFAAQLAYRADAYLSNVNEVIWRLFHTSFELEQLVDATNWCDEGRRRFPAEPRFVECQLQMLTAVPTAVPSAWALMDAYEKVVPPAQWDFARRKAQIFVAAAIARAGLRDSARRVLDVARATPAIDPAGNLLFREAYVRTLLGETDEAIRLLKEYLSAQPEHRSGLARESAWFWRDLRRDRRFQELVGTTTTQ